MLLCLKEKRFHDDFVQRVFVIDEIDEKYFSYISFPCGFLYFVLLIGQQRQFATISNVREMLILTSDFINFVKTVWSFLWTVHYFACFSQIIRQWAALLRFVGVERCLDLEINADCRLHWLNRLFTVTCWYATNNFLTFPYFRFCFINHSA